jgi:hypothetical protein
MGRLGRVPIPPVNLPPAAIEAIVLLVIALAVTIAAVLMLELLLTRSAAFYLRATGHRPPRKSRLTEDLERLQRDLGSRR